MQRGELHSAAALSLFQRLITDHGFDARSLGLNEELARELAALDFNDQASLIREAKHYLDMSIDVEALQRALRKVERSRTDRETEDYYLVKYAPYRLMNQLFGMHATEFSQRRKRLGIDGKSGRPVICDEDTDAMIWKLWKANEHLELKERYPKVAELANQNIDTIWASLQRVDPALTRS